MSTAREQNLPNATARVRGQEVFDKSLDSGALCPGIAALKHYRHARSLLYPAPLYPQQLDR
jgi:hypothetical protein